MLVTWVYVLISSYISIILLALETAGGDCLKIVYAFFIYLGNSIAATQADNCWCPKLDFKNK